MSALDSPQRLHNYLVKIRQKEKDDRAPMLTLLRDAIRLDKSTTVSFLALEGLDVNDRMYHDLFASTAMEDAMFYNSVESARVLLNLGATTSSNILFKARSFKMMQFLLENGIGTTVADLSKLLRLVVLESRNKRAVDIVRLLLQYGADPTRVDRLEIVDPDNANTAKILVLLLRAGLDLRAVSHDGSTLLERALQTLKDDVFRHGHKMPVYADIPAIKLMVVLGAPLSTKWIDWLPKSEQDKLMKDYAVSPILLQRLAEQAGLSEVSLPKILEQLKDDPSFLWLK